MEVFLYFYILVRIRGEEGSIRKNFVYLRELSFGFVRLFFYRYRFLLNIIFGINYFNYFLIRDLEFFILFFNEEIFLKNMIIFFD